MTNRTRPTPTEPGPCANCGWRIEFDGFRWRHMGDDSVYCNGTDRIAIPRRQP